MIIANLIIEVEEHWQGDDDTKLFAVLRLNDTELYRTPIGYSFMNQEYYAIEAITQRLIEVLKDDN